MKGSKPLLDENDEVRELTYEDFKAFRPVSQVLSPELIRELDARRRGPQRAATKERTTIRLSRDVLQQFRATGPGWQTRIDAALRQWLETHSPASST
jgi:uncharacterized protein (DUF4415 family)